MFLSQFVFAPPLKGSQFSQWIQTDKKWSSFQLQASECTPFLSWHQTTFQTVRGFAIKRAQTMIHLDASLLMCSTTFDCKLTTFVGFNYKRNLWLKDYSYLHNNLSLITACIYKKKENLYKTKIIPKISAVSIQHSFLPSETAKGRLPEIHA